jgi:hypothetical protein
MSHVSSVSDTAYAYLATLSRLDTNSDGVLSRSERAADEKPGIIKQFSEDERQVDARSTATASVMALMMGMRPNNAGASIPVTSNDAGVADLYRNTYGQYDLDIAS